MILIWMVRTNLCLQKSGSSGPRRGGESIVILKRRDRWLAGSLGVLSSFSSSSHLTLFFGTYVIKQTFAVSVGSRGRGLIHYRRDRQNIRFGICSSDNKNLKQIVLQSYYHRPRTVRPYMYVITYLFLPKSFPSIAKL